MTRNLIVILLLISSTSFAQINLQPTQFDKFVKKTNIEWAAYANDSFYFTNPALNSLLIKRFADKKIKASLPVYSRTNDANQVQYLSKDAIDKLVITPAHQREPVTDSNGDVQFAAYIPNNPKASVYNITEVTQILFIKKGKLKSYIPWVTPTLPQFLSTGKYIGESFYFNTAYNFKYNKKFRKKNKLIFLSQTKKMISLKPETAGNHLKEMFGLNLLETLWPYVLKGKIDVFLSESNVKINPDECKNALLYKDKYVIPEYDSTNSIYSFKTVGSPTPLIFTELQLVQDWYYDLKRNKVSNTIKEAYLYPKKPNNQIPVTETTPVLKMVFK